MDQNGRGARHGRPVNSWPAPGRARFTANTTTESRLFRLAGPFSLMARPQRPLQDTPAARIATPCNGISTPWPLGVPLSSSRLPQAQLGSSASGRPIDQLQALPSLQGQPRFSGAFGWPGVPSRRHQQSPPRHSRWRARQNAVRAGLKFQPLLAWLIRAKQQGPADRCQAGARAGAEAVPGRGCCVVTGELAATRFVETLEPGKKGPRGPEPWTGFTAMPFLHPISP